MGGASFPYATSTMVATGTVSLLSQATTTQYTSYTPFANFVQDSRGFKTTYFTLNGVLVGAYTYQTGNEAGTARLTFIHTNYLGTPVLETDEKGDIVQMDITDVFGNYVQRDQRKDNAYHDKGYTSHEFDDITGLNYAHARYLSAPMHSFISVDPMLYALPQSYLTDPQQMNSYAYARNNPIIYTDPTGMIPSKQGAAGIGSCLIICSLSSAYSAVSSLAKTYFQAVTYQKTNVNSWANNVANTMSAFGSRYSNPQTSASQARTDLSSAYSSVSNNASQLWNAKTYDQGYTAMQGPVGTAIQIAAPVGVTKTFGLLSDTAKAGEATKLVSSGFGSTGRTTASTLNEAILMRSVQANPSLGQAIPNMSPLTDPRWSGWSKYQYKTTTSAGENVNIHYNALLDDSGQMTGVDDFKFK